MTDIWHELRSKNIGGSEVAALFNESPHTTHYELWHIKRGLIPPKDLDGDPRVQAGKFFEKGALDWANYKWGLDFYQPEIYVQHPNVDGMGCTPDAYSKSDPNLMAQVKTVDSMQFSPKFGWECDGETITKAPLHILLQVQHEMECCQKAQSYLIVVVGGNRLLGMICDYDREIGSILRKKVLGFWLDSKAPEPDFKRDGPAIREIKSKLPIVKYEDFSFDKHLHEVLLETKALRVEIAQKMDYLDELEARVNYLLPPADCVKCGDILVKAQHRKGTPDRVITAKDIGQTIKGRKPSRSLKIIDESMPF